MLSSFKQGFEPLKSARIENNIVKATAKSWLVIVANNCNGYGNTSYKCVKSYKQESDSLADYNTANLRECLPINGAAHRVLKMIPKINLSTVDSQPEHHEVVLHQVCDKWQITFEVEAF